MKMLRFIFIYLLFTFAIANTNRFNATYGLRVKTPTLCAMGGTKQYSGYLDTAQNKHFFFWFTEAQNQSSYRPTPLIVWLNGGPGCSSLMGSLAVLGPCRLNKQGDGVVNNPHAWNQNAHLLFIDQPAGVGYSYGQPTNTSTAAADDFLSLIQLFYKAFPEYSYGDLHLFGESYTGKYITAMGKRILDFNRQQKWRHSKIPLASIGLGNGLVNPKVQLKYTSTMLCNSTYPPVVPAEVCHQMDQSYSKCARMIDDCYSTNNATSCQNAYLFCEKNIDYRLVIENPSVNPYDVRQKCKQPPFCYAYPVQVANYLNQTSVQHALGAEEMNFHSCSDQVGKGFVQTFDILRSYQPDLVELVNAGIPALLYNGDADAVCSWYGTKGMLMEMNWWGRLGFMWAQDRLWSVNGKRAGQVRSNGALTFVRVFGAGHIVPRDQPLHALDMVNQWILSKQIV